MATSERVERERGRLPRGRHGLPREAIASQQRERILRATVDVVAARGYNETRVADVIAEAGVSRKTFYELFDDREECFLTAYDVVTAILLKVTRDGYESKPEARWPERARLGLAAFLQVISEEPAAAKVCIVEVLAAGPKALARRDSAMRQFTHFIDAGRAEASTELPGITSLGLIGGLYELLYTEILHGATANLPLRLPELTYWVTLPFLGTEGAAEERERGQAMLRAAEESGEPVAKVNLDLRNRGPSAVATSADPSR